MGCEQRVDEVVRKMNIMRNVCVLLLGVGASLKLCAASNQTLTYTIPTVQTLSVVGSPTFTFVAPTAGQNFDAVTNSTSTYNVTSNLGAGKGNITCGLTSGTLPTGLSLFATLSVPSGSGATNSPVLVRTTSATNAITGLNNGAYPNSTITYVMTADVASAAVTASSNIGLTFTLVVGP